MITLYSEYHVLNTESPDKNIKFIHIKSREKIFPGQFYMIYVKGVGETPIFPYITEENILCFPVENNKDSLSQKLFSLKPKDSIFIRGPYGKGFPMNNYLSKDLKILFSDETLPQTISLLNYVIKNEESYGKTSLFLYNSKKTSPHLSMLNGKKEIPLNEITSLEKLGDDVIGLTPRKDQVYFVMVGFHETKQLINSLTKAGVNEKNIYFFLNRKITCGSGICGMCATKGMHTCIDGPVFRSDSIEKVL